MSIFLHAFRGRQWKKYLLQIEKQVNKHCLLYHKIWSNYKSKDKQKHRKFHYVLRIILIPRKKRLKTQIFQIILDISTVSCSHFGFTLTFVPHKPIISILKWKVAEKRTKRLTFFSIFNAFCISICVVNDESWG